MNDDAQHSSYKAAGVDIEAGYALVNAIKPFAKRTSRPGAEVDLGGFGGAFDLGSLSYTHPILVSGTDGVGTKLNLAFDTDKHHTVGIDLVAMCVNDIVTQGAEPLFFLDYYATSKLRVEVASKVIEGIAEGCSLAGCALIGGETAEMPGMYDENHYDLAGFAVGVAEKGQLLPKNTIEDGDLIIGIASSGIHSNGFSLVRKIIKQQGLSLENQAPFASTSLGESLLTPTRIYVKPCLELYRNTEVKAFAHITGGGLTENIPRALPKDKAAYIDASSWNMPEVFSWMKKSANITPEEMLNTFNCGIGMVAIITEKEFDNLSTILTEHQLEHYVIGHIGNDSSEEQIQYTNIETSL